MFKRLVNNLFGGKPLSYDEAKELARHEDTEIRLKLARRRDVRAEILYFLADDPSTEVRRAIANNESTPKLADLVLAKDSDQDVRTDLATKISKLAPGLSADEQDRVRQAAYQTLEILARDQATLVRKILAETLQDVTNAPPEVIKRLAHDVEIVVAGPVLQYSPVLTDADLMEIIAGKPASLALQAISKRHRVSEPIVDAVCETDDEEAIAVLLGNQSAQIREETLDRLAERAADIELWHEPLVRHPRLPAKAAQRMAVYVAENLLDILTARKDFDAKTTKAVKAEVRRRVEAQTAKKPRKKRAKAEPKAAAMATKAEPKESEKPVTEGVKENVFTRANKLLRAGKLDDDVFLKSIKANETEFVKAAVAARGNLAPKIIQRIFRERKAKGIVAACWKAGLPIDITIMIQRDIAFIGPRDMLYAGPGNSYPLTPDDLRLQLDIYEGLGK